MRFSGRILAIVVGTAATVGAAALGLANLQGWFERTRVRDRDREQSDVAYFLRGHSLDAATLMQAETFSSPKVGYGGEPPAIARELNDLLVDPNGEAKLAYMVDHGASGAVLYGACGLRLLGSVRPAAGSFAGDDRRVALVNGCSISVAEVREALTDPRFEEICRAWGEARAVLRKAR